MKKIIFTILLLAMAINSYAYDFSAVCSTGQTLYYNIDGGNVTVTYPGGSEGYAAWSGYTKPSGSLVIPSSVVNNGVTYNVNRIGQYAFYYCTGITTVTIPNTVTVIDISAFYSCTNMTLVSLPESLTSIGYCAFTQCTSLLEVNMPNSLTSIGHSVFQNCYALASVTLSNAITGIGAQLFQNCSSLHSIIIPSSVTNIGNTAFSGCSSLAPIVIPSSVNSIGNNAFYNVDTILYAGSAAGSPWGANHLVAADGGYYENGFVYSDNTKTTVTGYIGTSTTITIPSTVTTIAANTFNGKTNLTSVTIPNSVTTIGSYAFSGCTGLISMNIPNSVTNIGTFAFQNCSGIESLYLGSGITNIGMNAFQGCTGIVSMYYNIPNCSTGLCSPSSNNTPFYNTLTPNFTTLVIGDSVQSIPSFCFYERHGINNLQIGNNVTTIGYGAFDGCNALTHLVIPNSVTEIGELAFYGCGIDSLFLGTGVTTIARRAFSQCSSVSYIYYNAANNTSGLFGSGNNNHPFYNTSTPNLTTIVIGDSVQTIPARCFYNRQSVTNLQFENGVTTIGNYAFYNCYGITNLSLPNSLTNIGSNAFESCTGLTALTLPNSITEIGYSAFNNCNSISSLTLPDSLISIGENAFYNCNNITKLIIPNSVTSIGGTAFFGCSGIDSLYIGSGVTIIGNDAFQGCSNLKYLFYNAANNPRRLFGISDNTHPPFYNTITPYFTTLVIGDSVRSIPSGCFYELSRINNFQMGNNVETIGDNAFNGCSNITNLTIPNTTTTIGNYAFYGCRKIHSLSIPGSVQVIGNYAFDYCDSLEFLYLGDGVETIGDNAFEASKIHMLVIPQSVTSIGASAFKSCLSLDSLYIHSTNATIGNSAFVYCNSLKYVYFNLRNPQVLVQGTYPLFSNHTIETVVIGDSVQLIPSYYLNGKTRLKRVQFGTGITSIGGNAFSQCTKLKGITIPDNVSSIGQNAFNECSSMDSLYLGSGVLTVGNNAFKGCTGLKYLNYNNGNVPLDLRPTSDIFSQSVDSIQTLIIGDSVRTIPSCGMKDRTSITKLHIGTGLTSIADSAFYGCTGIHNVSIPDNITHIGQRAFYGCSGIDSLYIGRGVQTIGAVAFSGCTGLKYMYYNAQNCVNALFAIGNNAPFANTTTNQFTTLEVGNGVEIIPANAFRSRTSLTQVNISDSVASIGETAFYGCSGIQNLHISTGITSVADYTFYGCSNVQSLNIPNGVTSIGYKAFYNCSNVNNLNIPDAVTSIGKAAFYGCSGIQNLHISTGITAIADSTFYGCSNVQSVIIPNSVASIGREAFYGCSSFNSLTIPDAVTSIGYAAFQGCSSIGGLQIGSGITSIADNTFFGCSSIGSIVIPNGVTSIGNSAFKGCTAANSLTLGSGLTHIGDNAFSECDNILMANINAQYVGKEAFANCDRLLTVTLGNSVNTLSRGAFKGCFRLQNFTFGSGIDTIPSGVFSGCVRLENMQLSSGVHHIGDSAFYNCPLIHDIVMPEGLTSIGNYAFYGCSGISGILEFPSTMTTIGNNAFRNIGTVSRLRMFGSTPPTIFSNTFYSISNSTPVEVPCGAIQNYYITNYWENFPNIVEGAPFHLTVAVNNAVMGSASVTQQPTCNNYSALIQATANSGYHFLEWNDGSSVNPRQVNISSDTVFTAFFAVNASYITAVPNDPLMGTVSGTGTYNYNAPVMLTATAYDGFHFLRWNDGNTQNPRYLAATRDSSFTAIFVSNVSTITVANANPEMGNVSGSGVYYYQNLVSITATANYGYHFSQWNDGNTQNPRTITINQDSAFTAYFAPNTYSIVASSNSTTMGSVSGSGSYTYLHEMSMTATPAYGYHFVQWNDQITDNPRTITVTRDSAFTAQFAANSYTITAEPNDPTMGSAYGSGTYNFNTSVTLTAVAEYGYHFTQWSDGVTDNPRTITVQNSATYTAQFEINSYILTVQSSNPAIGTTSGGGSYNYLTPVNITANPNAGYHFTQWSDGNTDNPRLVTVTQNATYVAQFAINSYVVGVVSGNTSMGSVSGSGTYNHNATATLTATAFYGYHFVQWSDGNTDNPRSVVVTDSAQYTAEFTYNSYLVTGNSSNVTLGSVTGGGSYNYLSQVALTAVPVPHYHFTMWNDSIEDNPRTITVTRDTTFTAHFVIDRHTIGVNTADATQGTVDGSDTVNYNTAVWISATANYGYHFAQWNDGNTSNPRRIVVSQDTVFTASFAPNQYTATCAVNDTVMGASVITQPAAPQAGMSTYQGTYLTSLIVTATANYGYNFVQWSDGVTDNPRSFTLTRDTLFTAVFVVNQYMLNVTSNDSTLGTVQGSGSYDYLSQVTITATAAPHSHFVQWNDGNTTNPRLVTLIRDTNFTAIFESDLQYQITVNANDTTMGSVTGSGMYYNGESVTITATANDHYYFAQWSDGNTSNPRVVTVSGEATYTAVFEPVMYTVTVTANDYSMGQVTGGGSYAYGTSVTLEARAFDDYRFVRWSDGDTAAVRAITVTEDIQLEATFERKHPDGIDDVDGMSYNAYAQYGHIVVEGLENNPNARVMVFDVAGRRHSLSETFPTGVYMVQIGRWTKKVVVL